MNKLIIIFAFTGLFSISNYISSTVEVVKKATATKVKPGYYLKDDDSTFVYKGNKYLIITDEAFDTKGNIVKASIAGDVGYSIYTESDFNKYKKLIDEYSLTKIISVKWINDRSILLNGKKITAEVDKRDRMIYYNLKSSDTLYRIIYR